MKTREFSRWFGILTATFGVLLMLYGLYRNELDVLFTKAINICLECIGIG